MAPQRDEERGEEGRGRGREAGNPVERQEGAERVCGVGEGAEQELRRRERRLSDAATMVMRQASMQGAQACCGTKQRCT